MEAAFVNPGPDYLSACEKPLPSLYFYFCLANLAALVAWVAALCTKTGTKVHKLHFMMAALLVLKVGTLLSESIRYRAISETGSGEAWSYVYYTLSGLKGVMLFVVILLIGTGCVFVARACAAAALVVHALRQTPAHARPALFSPGTRS